MWPDLLRALALVLVIEGLMPFLAPERWREMMLRLSDVDGRSLRVFGGVLIGVGVLLLQFIH
ncbi:DUF2065 domain-containing protein [Endozoicomonas sp. G2_2]|uniref:DUF2065 domain-containing protein n=1 Tax=Gammaproteobacteria TaxID=1236 RepID=UPI000C4551BA|nr:MULTISPECIES: DUF2065 domain-containing protein [Gammaproteobacteria]MAS11572.1 DUF2065 domain-containing protein [Salinisphaera sp.]MBO9470316.1 DUF2065 domain-containing protein [Endozoicomonas sp. G2_2]|tara:strand:+ start:538 stop:723 length:186 start_codon:yes stop_codon:yes gene_type:complete